MQHASDNRHISNRFRSIHRKQLQTPPGSAIMEITFLMEANDRSEQTMQLTRTCNILQLCLDRCLLDNDVVWIRTTRSRHRPGLAAIRHRLQVLVYAELRSLVAPPHRLHSTLYLMDETGHTLRAPVPSADSIAELHPEIFGVALCFCTQSQITQTNSRFFLAIRSGMGLHRRPPLKQASPAGHFLCRI